jgi:betaine-aldehyde dehydrogenase
MAAWKVAPCLAAGSCALLKPSEYASLTCQALADIVAAAGVPPGVFQLLTGLGGDAGAPLVAHPRVDKVAFTGSLATGRRVMAACCEGVKPLTLELGGKSAVIVFDEPALADEAALDRVVEWVMFGIFWTNGQICSATSRLLVQDSLAPRLLARLKIHAEAVAVGDPLCRDPPTRLGPLVSALQYAKVGAMVAQATAEGAQLLTGGARPASCPRGYFIAPTVLTGVTPAMAIFREEVFGPVLAVTTFSSEAEAVALANGTDYALGAAVLSDDVALRSRLTDALECGLLWLGCSQPCFCQSPWVRRARRELAAALTPTSGRQASQRLWPGAGS